MKFRTEESSHNQATTSNIVPEHCREFVIPFANVTYTEGPFGGILSQKIKANNYSILLHHLFIKEAVTLFAFSNRPTINYMLEGTPVAKLEGTGAVPIIAGNYQMLYMRTLKLELRFAAGNYHCIQIAFDPAYLKELIGIGDNEPQQILSHSSGKINARTKAILSEIMQGQNSRGIRDLQLQLTVLELLLQHIKNHYSFGAYTDTERFLALEKLINENLEKPLHIETLAQFCGKSQSELHRLFKLHFGQSPHHFIQTLRIKRSMELIISTEYPIGSIAKMVGFNDLSYFSNAFKRNYGNPPSFYR